MLAAIEQRGDRKGPSLTGIKSFAKGCQIHLSKQEVIALKAYLEAAVGRGVLVLSSRKFSKSVAAEDPAARLRRIQDARKRERKHGKNKRRKKREAVSTGMTMR